MPQNQYPTSRADFRVTYHGVMPTITPLNAYCRGWIEHYVDIEPWQHFGESIAIEPGHIERLAQQMIEEGFIMEEGG